MKSLLVMLLSIGLVVGATAQPKIRSGAVTSIRGGYTGGTKVIQQPSKTNVIVVRPYRSIYPYYGMGMGYGYGMGMRYSPFYDPFYAPQVIERTPTELDLQIEDIENEYDFKIEQVNDDKSLPRDVRKQQVKQLKHDKKDAIIDAKKAYYSRKDRNNN